MSCGAMFGTDAVVLPMLCGPWGRVTDTPGVMFEGGGALSVSNHSPWTFHSDGSERLPFQNRKLLSPSLLAYSVLPNRFHELRRRVDRHPDRARFRRRHVVAVGRVPVEHGEAVGSRQLGHDGVVLRLVGAVGVPQRAVVLELGQRLLPGAPVLRQERRRVLHAVEDDGDVDAGRGRGSHVGLVEPVGLDHRRGVGDAIAGEVEVARVGDLVVAHEDDVRRLQRGKRHALELGHVGDRQRGAAGRRRERRQCRWRGCSCRRCARRRRSPGRRRCSG